MTQSSKNHGVSALIIGRELASPFFMTDEELQEPAEKLDAGRLNFGSALTSAQRIPGQYHLPFCDLQAVLLGDTSDIEDVPQLRVNFPSRR